MNKNIKKICISPKQTIKDVLGVLASNKPAETNIPAGVILVVDAGGRLEGIATDGDIRRALAGGVAMQMPISTIMNRNVFYVEGPVGNAEILASASAKIRSEGWHKSRLEKIVVVDAEHRVLDLVSFFDLWQSSDVRAKRIGVIGLGFVGLTLALTLADLGFEVVGYDKNAELRSLIKRKKPPFFEVGLEGLLHDHLGKRFRLAENLNEKEKADVYFIAVGTPLGTDHEPHMGYIVAAAEELGSVLKSGDTVILRSTVPLGTTRSVVIPVLERVSGLTAGDDFFVAFAPERTVEGKALEELRTLPQVVGGINRASANIVSNIFNLMTDTVFTVDSLEEAEMVKLINNTYRDVTFAFANEVSLVCQKWGIDTNKVINAANMGYPRSNVPKPSPGVGGYCLEKDPFIFIKSAQARGYEPTIPVAARGVNEKMVSAVADTILTFLKEHKKKDPKVVIFGIAFKGNPPTSDLRGSPSVALIKLLQTKRVKHIVGYDPQVPAKEIHGLGVESARTPAAGIKGADAVIVMTNHPEFGTYDMRTMLGKASDTVLFFDTWSLYNKDEINKVKGMVYKHL